jgi:hypothetical protein
MFDQSTIKCYCVCMKKVPLGKVVLAVLLSLIMFCIAGLVIRTQPLSPEMVAGVTFFIFFGVAPLMALRSALKKSRPLPLR